MSLNGFRVGLEKEKEAKEILREKFTTISSSKHNSHYDYLARLAQEKLYIEVKWRHILHSSVLFQIDFRQMIALSKLPRVLFYFMTNRGNIFVPFDEVLTKSHIHYNALNPLEERIVIRVKVIKGKLKIEEPDGCLLCRGRTVAKWSVTKI